MGCLIQCQMLVTIYNVLRGHHYVPAAEFLEKACVDAVEKYIKKHIRLTPAMLLICRFDAQSSRS